MIVNEFVRSAVFIGWDWINTQQWDRITSQQSLILLVTDANSSVPLFIPIDLRLTSFSISKHLLTSFLIIIFILEQNIIFLERSTHAYAYARVQRTKDQLTHTLTHAYKEGKINSRIRLRTRTKKERSTHAYAYARVQRRKDQLTHTLTHAYKEGKINSRIRLRTRTKKERSTHAYAYARVQRTKDQLTLTLTHTCSLHVKQGNHCISNNNNELTD